MKIKLPVKITRGLSNISHAVGKHSPLILTAVGVVGLGATAVFSYKAAKKMEVIVEEMEEANANQVELDRVEVGKKVIGALALPVVTGTLSVVAIGASYWVQNNRIGALTAALTTATAERVFYHNKFKEEFGEEKAQEFYKPTAPVRKLVTDEEGNEKTEVRDIRKDIDTMHGVWFTESTEYAVDDHAYNMRFIRSAEEHLTSKLFSTGWLRLNEVMDALGLPRTKAGELVGWTTGGSNFDIETIVSHNWDVAKNRHIPEIYVSWSSPTYIYDDVEYRW